MEGLSKIKSQLQTLSSRERNLITITSITAVIVLIYFVISGIINYQKSLNQQVLSKTNLIEQISQSAKRNRSLKNKLENLTTKYLNSSLSYEDLTNRLDKLSTSIIGADAYELIPSKEKTELGTEFLARKFTIKIKQCSYEQILKMLESLEQGPPPLFLQKLDLSKSYDNKSFSAILEIVSVQEVKS